MCAVGAASILDGSIAGGKASLGQIAAMGQPGLRFCPVDKPVDKSVDDLVASLKTLSLPMYIAATIFTSISRKSTTI
jgi:hypothetical protein